MLRIPSLRDSISIALENCSKQAEERIRLLQVCNKGGRQSDCLVGMLRIPSPRDSISIALENCSKQAEERIRLLQVCNEGGRQSEHQRLLLSKENQISSQGI